MQVVAVLLCFTLWATTRVQSQKVDMKVGQSGTDMYIAWSGVFEAPSDGAILRNNIDVSRFILSTNYIVGFAQVEQTYYDTGITAINPFLGETVTEFYPSNLPAGDIFGDSSIGFSNTNFFLSNNHVFGTPFAGCVRLAGSLSGAGYFDVTDHVGVTWTPTGFGAQQLLFQMEVTSHDLPSECGGPGPSVAATTSGGSGGSGGDPHFTTWNGTKYDFHGHCDLLLVQSDSFRDGTGLAVHIRSAPFQDFYSFISHVAIRIGDHVLELGPHGTRVLNGVGGDSRSHQPPLTLFAGLPVDHKRIATRDANLYTIHLEDHCRLMIRDMRGWYRVHFEGARAKDFRHATGLMGSFGTGTWLARDGRTIMDESSIDNFGMEWQVKEELDGLLFSTPSPFPDKCELRQPFGTGTWLARDGRTIMDESSIDNFGMEWQVKEELDGLLFSTPSPFPDKCELRQNTNEKKRRRRLSEGVVSHFDAATACMKWGDGGFVPRLYV